MKMRTNTLVVCPLFFCVFLVMLRAGEPNEAQLQPGHAKPSARATNELRGHVHGFMRKRYTPQAHSCTSDRECGTGLYCYAPRHAPSRCSRCRRRGRRCYRDSMCCPGNHCHNYACTKWTQRMPGVKNQFTSSARQQKLKKTSSRLHKAAAGSQCVRSEDCSPAHCCARHLWTRVCKAEPRKGEACSAPLQNKDSHRVELFQRCLCTSSLSCRPQTPQAHTHHHQPGYTRHTAAALRTCQEL